MKRVILLRFHKLPEVVQNRIDILKKVNPGTPIYGLFGGEQEEFAEFQSLKGLENLTFLSIKDKVLKWRCSDLAILQWYKDFGHTVEFDVVHTIEWDLILLEKLELLYPYQEHDKHIYLTCPIELEKVIDSWFWFVHPEFPIEESKEFVKHITEKYGLTQHYASQGPGTTLTRAFLDGYAKLDLPPIAHDELRLPAIAQILKIPFKDTGFAGTDWFNENSETYKLFNCDKLEVTPETVKKVYSSGQRKTFHPVYEPIELSW